MAGHSKFKNIMYRKGAQDKKRAKVFTKLIKDLQVATRSGLPDPEMNPSLKAAVIAANAANMPKDNIDRAIKRASGAGEGEAFEEYVRCFNEKTIFGSCEDYRACATTDLEMDTVDVENGVTFEKPTLILWGGKSHTGTVHGDLIPIWKKWCPNAIGGPIDCGHYTQEEAPDDVYDWFMKFFLG